MSGLAHSRRTYDQFLRDVVQEYNECTGTGSSEYNSRRESGSVVTTIRVNIRKNVPSTRAPIVRTVPPGTTLQYTEIIDSGESVNGNSVWNKDQEGNCFWSGATM
ncbi:MAG: hypothetical protein HY960_10605 [Ignavibacteriae bacterium]|nr:hypothetical protein [Ignavibacteriota bacterium]